jgi:hypothetical protein
MKLAIGGMTCAAYAVRLEKVLNRVEGVAKRWSTWRRNGRVCIIGPVSSASMPCSMQSPGRAFRRVR